jgi:hypothetical protein
MLLDLRNSYDISKARAYLDKMIEKGEQVELRKIQKQRTLRQNAYLHVCLAMFCAETGYTIDEGKELFSLQLPDILRYTKNEVNFRKSTADLDTKEMSILIDKIREMALDQLGLYIPSSEEYIENRFQIERELEMAGVR